MTILATVTACSIGFNIFLIIIISIVHIAHSLAAARSLMPVFAAVLTSAFELGREEGFFVFFFFFFFFFCVTHIQVTIQ